MNNLGGVLQDQADLAGARAAYERALAIVEKVYGPEHPIVGTAINNLSGVLRAQGDLAGARAAFARALAIVEKVYGPEHTSVAIAVNNLGGVLRAQAGARVAYERAPSILHARLGAGHPTTHTVQRNLNLLTRN
jgi:hypothetical protein